MIDREKVLTWLEICGEKDDCSGCCPYGNEGATFYCETKLMADAFALLKEQEPKPIDYKENRLTGLSVAICPNCGRFARQFHTEHPDEETKFCPWCGQEVKW